MPDAPLDVVGVGALNLDCIVPAAVMSGEPGTALARRIRHRVERTGVPLPPGAESWVDETVVQDVLDVVGAVAAPVTVLGGSAYNTVRALAKTGLDLRLGYAGVAGRSPVPGVSVRGELDGLGIDGRHVRDVPDRLCGVCVSFAEDGERTLLTHAGANARMAAHLEASFTELVRYLSRARIVQVTSLVGTGDDDTASRLAALLAAVRRTGSGTRVGFDPGHGWSAVPSRGVDGILAATDHLLVNRQEFEALSGGGTGGTVDLLGRLGARGPGPAVFVKRPDGVQTYELRGGEAVGVFHPHRALPASEIEDATGAGDVFAAGLLAVLARHPGEAGLGCRLGMALARHKLRHVGIRGTRFAQVARAVLGTGPGTVPGRAPDPGH